jgi:hypothetical protein
MIQLSDWNRNVPGSIYLTNGYVDVEFIGCERVADVTNLLKFKIGNKSFKIGYPSINDGYMSIRGTVYVGIQRILRPPVTNDNKGREKEVCLRSVSGQDIRFFITRGADFVSAAYGSKKFWYKMIPPSDIRLLTRFVTRPVDRIWMNEKFGLDIAVHHITVDDVASCYNLFTKLNAVWNWKHISNLRILTVEDSLLCYISNRFHNIANPNYDNDSAQRLIDKFWFGNPQVQWIDPNLSDIAKLSITQKVHYPIERFDELVDTIPDESACEYLDFLSTPQSDKAGEIVSLIDGVAIKDGRFVKLGRSS